MTVIRRHFRRALFFALVCVPLALAACTTSTDFAATPQGAVGFDTPQNSSPNDRAVETAEIMRANAQATLNAAQTQDENSANSAAAQLAAAAANDQARAEATLVAAGSTRSAALAEDAIRHTQAADVATSSAEGAATQTESANAITTQTQMAVQWSANQARQRAEDVQAPIAFLWAWCLPPFIILLGGVALWGFWRWLKLRHTHQEIMDDAMEQREFAVTAAIHQDDASSPHLEGEDLGSGYHVTQPEDPVHRWLEEVKGKLQRADRKDEHNDADN
ncbi:MAG: hypothetical protein ACM3MF_07175 [Anaerolineae bacterium]